MNTGGTKILKKTKKSKRSIDKQLRAIVAEDGDCFSCYGYQDQLNMLCPHHIISRGAGGSHEPSNILTTCAGCHREIHDGHISVLKILERYKTDGEWRWKEVYEYLKNRKGVL